MRKIGYIIPTFRESKNEISDYINSINSYFNFEIEVVIVNDNPSKNMSLDDFGYIPSNIKVSIVNNKIQVGPGEARNIGFNLINSEWVGFLDDDDKLLLRPLEGIDKKITLNVDIICLQFEDSRGTFSNLPILNKLIDLNNINAEIYCKQLKSLGRLPTHCQHYLFKTDFLRRNSIKFLPLSVIEDITFIAEAIFNADKIAYDNNPYYFYNSKSGTSKEDVGLDKLFEIYTAIVHIKNLYKLSLAQSRHEQKIMLKRTIAFLESFFISRFISVTSKDIENEILKKSSNLKYFNYLNKINKKVKFIIDSKLINSEIIILYCYCPMALGLLEYLKSKFENQKNIILLDDGVNNSTIIKNTNLMHPSIYLELIADKVLPLRCKSIDLIICHLHQFIHEKISNDFSPKLLKLAPASTKINVIAFQNLF